MRSNRVLRFVLAGAFLVVLGISLGRLTDNSNTVPTVNGGVISASKNYQLFGVTPMITATLEAMITPEATRIALVNVLPADEDKAPKAVYHHDPKGQSTIELEWGSAYALIFCDEEPTPFLTGEVGDVKHLSIEDCPKLLTGVLFYVVNTDKTFVFSCDCTTIVITEHGNPTNGLFGAVTGVLAVKDLWGDNEIDIYSVGNGNNEPHY